MKLSISSKILASALLTAGSIFFLATSSASAASFTVAAGNDENTDNASCSLSEAIENINDQAATNTDCPAGDGVNDTINIPAGTITLTADLPTITESVSIAGAGMGQTIVDGDNGQYLSFNSANGVNNFAISDITVVDYKGVGIYTSGAKNIDIDKVEVDGTGALPLDPGQGGILMGILIGSDDSSQYSFNLNNVYVHDVSGDPGVVPQVAGVFVGFA